MIVLNTMSLVESWLQDGELPIAVTENEDEEEEEEEEEDDEEDEEEKGD